MLRLVFGAVGITLLCKILKGCLSQTSVMLSSVTWVTALLAGIFSGHIAQRLHFPYFWKDLFFLLKVIRYGIQLEIYKWTKRVL